MITKSELKAALGAVQWAVENGHAMACETHDKVCKEGGGCRDHACVMGTFVRALFGTSEVDGFPIPSEMVALFSGERLKPLAESAIKVIMLNDAGQFGDALAELKSAVESC
jgi:hypothetical protein